MQKIEATPQELEDKLTPVRSEDLCRELAGVWLDTMPTRPTKASIALLVAQWALETGWGNSMHCYNVGNIKSSQNDGRCWTFFPCGEELPESTAVRMRDASPSLVVIRKLYSVQVNGQPVSMASVYFRPKHPVTRFRAYRTLRAGVIDYLSLIRNRFKAAWPAVLRANPAEFARALKRAGYYTADENDYAKGLVGIHSKLCKVLEHAEFPALSAAEEAEIRALTALSLDAIMREQLAPDPDITNDDEPPISSA